MSNRLNEFFSRTVTFLHEGHPNKKRFPIVIALAVIFLLAGCGNNVKAIDQPPPKLTSTPTAFPIFYEVTPTPERPSTTETLQLGGHLELITTEGQPPDGQGVVVIEVVDWVKRDSTWQINVKSNMTHGVNLGCSFGDAFSCRGELSANGERWPNERQVTILNDKGIFLVGQPFEGGVKVTYDNRWNKK